MTDPIKAKVARILNTREVVLNAGTEEGVKLGMLFDILDPKGEEIKDPDTHEVLGSLSRPKVRVKVTKVHEHISVASTFQKKKVNIGGSGLGLEFGILSRAYMPANWVERYVTFKTDEQTWEDIDENKSYVKTGDPVIQVEEVLE